MSWKLSRPPGGRKSLWHRMMRLGEDLTTPFSEIWLQEVSNPQLSLGMLLYTGHGQLSCTPLVQREELMSLVGWFLHPPSICSDSVLWLCNQVQHSVVFGFGSTGIFGPGRWGGTRLGSGSPGSCRVPLATLQLWHGLLRLYRRACGCWGRQTPHITSLICDTFRPFEEISQVSQQLQRIAKIIQVSKIKSHCLLCWALGSACIS